MHILLTNDDGIHAGGLAAAAKALSTLGTVWVAAPASDQSGQSHHRHLHSTLRAEPVRFTGTAAAWQVHGTPADCVALALTTLVRERVDLVFSGVNQGANLSSNLLYSGTAAAALEGCLAGIPAMAVSCAAWDERSLEQAAVEATIIARARMGVSFPPVLNLNFPPAGRRSGLRVCRANGICRHPAPFRPDKAGRYEPPERLGEWSRKGEDVQALEQGYITVTPLSAEWTDSVWMKKVQEVLTAVSDGRLITTTGEDDT